MEENSSSSRECAPEAPSEEHSSDIPEEIQDKRSDSLEDEDASVADDHAIVKVPTNQPSHPRKDLNLKKLWLKCQDQRPEPVPEKFSHPTA